MKQAKSLWQQSGMVLLVIPLFISIINVTFATSQAQAAPNFTVSTFAGTYGMNGYVNGPASLAQMDHPHDIAFGNDGTIYVSDTTNHRIRAISPGGVVSTFAGSGVRGGADGTGTAAEFNDPHSIAINPTTGVLYVTEASLDNNTPRVRAITPAGVVTTLAGSGVPGMVDGTGTAAQFFFPTGIAVNPTNGIIYVADSYAHNIRAITPAGVTTTLAGYDDILDVVASPNGGYADGSGTAAVFSYPQGIEVAPDGTIYVGEFGGHKIRKITPAGVTTTLAGSGVAGFVDGTGVGAQFDRPTGVTVDSDGLLYIADTFNGAIRTISSEGVVATIAGTGALGYADGPGATAQFNAPTGIAFNATGELFITDTYNLLIRRLVITNASTPTSPIEGGGITTPGVPNTGVGPQESIKAPLVAALLSFGLLTFVVFIVRARKVLSKK